MKKHLLLSALSLSLLACEKADRENDVIPASITTAFNQDFALSYRQQATLPAATNPELTVAVSAMQYSFCPKDVICCFVPNFVDPTLTITDAQGQSQQVKLPANQPRNYNPTWIDTISVRANGQRYVVYYTKWDVKPGCDQPGIKDISVRLRVLKPTSATN
ncbi:hypothetical protein SAMN02745146_2787 [Hymenobacter daecheongensis DSM 21074]|uniref:Lipoprotein n=1 Tax=Hymenobacter daecheongensis DSM 21074 TaxID=1121955 RepID=A0A1M6I4H0_9BACT|nr:hypothetical protein [Hymenobacter daecheongensis]SHJ29323.1 hypothetical protein SAMN02745146_2787 [Hymenobacter daecheongensis DSM 21074]